MAHISGLVAAGVSNKDLSEGGVRGDVAVYALKFLTTVSYLMCFLSPVQLSSM